MSLINVGLLDAITAKMNWSDENQKVLAGNIANADTPDAKARTLKPMDFGQYLGSTGASGKLQMATTAAAHLTESGKPAGDGSFASTLKGTPYEVNPNKNGIVLEEQLVAAQKNAAEYALATNMYRKSVGMMKIALGVAK